MKIFKGRLWNSSVKIVSLSLYYSQNPFPVLSSQSCSDNGLYVAGAS